MTTPTSRGSPTARARSLGLALALAASATAALACAHPRSARADDAPPALYATLDAALAARADAASARSAVAACALAFEAHPEDLAVAERVVRARFFYAKRYAPADDAVVEHERAIAAGLAALGGAIGRELEDVDALDDHRADVPRAAVGVLYWTTLSYASTIESMSFFSQPGAARRFQRLVRRALELDEAYFHGGPHRVLADFLREAPAIVGGDLEEARSHAQKAVELGPSFTENEVVLAEVLAEDDDEAMSLAALERALALPLDGAPGAVPEQRFALARARVLHDEARAAADD